MYPLGVHATFDEEPGMSVTRTYTVIGMTCEHCVRAVTGEVGKLDGVTSVEVDLASGRVTVASDRPLDDAALAAAVDEAGYAVAP
jgi:copper chaperone